MATGLSALSWPPSRPSPPRRLPLQRDSLRDVMEVFLFIAAGGRCTLVSMNKRRAGGEINNEDGELKMEAARSERVCVCECVCV